jgi:hypothetical protein
MTRWKLTLRQNWPPVEKLKNASHCTHACFIEFQFYKDAQRSQTSKKHPL